MLVRGGWRCGGGEGRRIVPARRGRRSASGRRCAECRRAGRRARRRRRHAARCAWGCTAAEVRRHGGAEWVQPFGRADPVALIGRGESPAGRRTRRTGRRRTRRTCGRRTGRRPPTGRPSGRCAEPGRWRPVAGGSRRGSRRRAEAWLSGWRAIRRRRSAGGSTGGGVRRWRRSAPAGGWRTRGRAVCGRRRARRRTRWRTPPRRPGRRPLLAGPRERLGLRAHARCGQRSAARSAELAGGLVGNAATRARNHSRRPPKPQETA